MMGGPRTIDEHLIVAKSNSVYTVDIDGEAVLLDEVENRLHHLNATGTLVWLCLDGESTIAEIVDDLSAGIGHPRDEVLADTLAVIRHLADEGLLEGFTRTGRWRRRDDVLWRRSLDGVVVFPAPAQDPVTLEGTGPMLWDLLEAPHSLEALATALATEHSANTAVVTSDIEPVLQELEAIGAIESVA